MDKKNTMLLTVIAVATLLVAVVGATFAYFAVTNTGSSATSAVTTTTEDVGVVALSNGVTEMHIKTTAADFASAVAAKTFYAVDSSTSTDNYADTETLKNVAVIQAQGGKDTTIYKCTFDFTATTTATKQDENSTAVTLQAGDMAVTLGGLVNLGALDLATDGNDNISKTVTVYLTGNEQKTITASVSLTNRAGVEQNYLTNAKIETNFSASNLSCDVVTEAGDDSIA